MNIINGVQNAWGNLQSVWRFALQRVFEEPALDHIQPNYYQREMEYLLLWSYYNGSAFEKTARYLNAWASTGWGTRTWETYKSLYSLPKNIRLIYNPTRRLVDFYAGAVYPGVLSEDGEDLPDGVQNAIPFSKDTDSTLKTAIAQLWQWNNWQERMQIEITYAAALGDCLVEIVDSLDDGKICFEIPWPGFVYDIDLDYAGNVKSYTLEYGAYDEDEGGFYRFKKIVDSNAFQYFKDDEPYAYDYGAAILENPYGFVPAVWFRHNSTGGNRGSPAIAGSMPLIDELNGQASLTHDQVRKVVGAPWIMWATGSIQNLFNQPPITPTSGFDQPTPYAHASDPENVLLLKGPQNGRIDSLAGNLDIPGAYAVVEKLLAQVEKNHPELTMYEQLRAMSQVTGPAAQRLVGDVETRVAKAQANYDRGNICLFQMALAIAGFRANNGDWGILNRQQQKFLPFNLDSYEAGDLDMAIMPRPLLSSTKHERAQENLALWQGVQAAAAAGVPPAFVLKQEGLTDQELADFEQAQQKEDAANQQKFEQQQKLIAAQAQNQPPQNQQQDNNQQQEQQNNNKQTIGQKG